ncbi:MAG: RIP metalloprotease RseP [Patescibacteria group bacterium]|nr:RIP metalloprotease RseP [Patescibacteria group bacterium]MDD5554621.1 RIP metalloprotease RseP [Patescibacteria group bacterium]
MILTIITFLIVFSLLIFAHELGHFWFARRFGVRAEEFGFGFPPRIFGAQILKGKKLVKIAEKEKVEVEVSEYETIDEQEIIKETITDSKQEIDELVSVKKWRFIPGSGEPEIKAGEEEMQASTIYSLNWIPLGGFVKIKGENGEEENDPDSFASRKIWQRATILSAGVGMNVILAAFLISLGLMIGFPQALDNLDSRARVSDKKIQITQIIPDSPAAQTGFMAGDTIIAINNEEFATEEELQNFVDSETGKELAYKIKRGQEEMILKAVPETREETGRGGIGIAIATTGLVKYPWYLAIEEGIKETALLTWAIIVAFYELIKNLIMGRGVAVDIAGPVGIAALTGQVAHMGLIYILQFTALLSINLAIINFLPFPALDGGRVLFLIIEKIKGSPVKRELETAIHNIGFALLMLLVLVVTFRDVARFGDSFRALWEMIINKL